MPPETPASLANVVQIGERLRMELLDVLRRAESAGVRTELVMLYGQAFRNVYEAALKVPSPGPLMERVMQECGFGLDFYSLWLVSETPVDAQDDYGRMAMHWRAVTSLVLTGRG